MNEIERLTGLREHFAQSGDRSLVDEINAQLARWGQPPEMVVVPLIENAAPVLERVISSRRKK